jgi:pilus assembly protein CpaC
MNTLSNSIRLAFESAARPAGLCQPCKPWCLVITLCFGAALSPLTSQALAASTALAAPAQAAASAPSTKSDPALGAAASAPSATASKPTYQRRAYRAPAVNTNPYSPIKKPGDEGLVPEIEMFVGESRVFPTPGVARVAVGNGGVMSAAPLDGKEIILFANGVGTSSLMIWNADGRYQRLKINIVPGDTSRFAREIAAFLTSIPNARASIIGDKVIVEGDNLSDADLNKIAKLAERYPQIVNFTNSVGWEQMIMMDVKVVEFPTSVLREVGLKWGATGGAAVGGIWMPYRRGNVPYQIDIRTGKDNSPPLTAPANNNNSGGGTNVAVPLTSSLGILSAVNLGLNAQLNLLAQEGKASILAEPQLSTRNGTPASFLAGGEIPYSVSNVNGTTIDFKQYGIKLNIEPRVDRNGVIRAKVDTEVSAIDNSVVSSIAGPALTTRRTKTEFNLQAGETFVLSGLLQRSTSTDIDKVPFLGDIPILGALFRSKRFQNKETELVVFVTPTLVDAKSPGMVDKVQKTTERLQQSMGTTTPYLTQPLQPGQDAARLGTVGAPALVVSPAAAAAASGAAVTPAPVTPITAPVTATIATPAPTQSSASAPPAASAASSSNTTAATNTATTADTRLQQATGSALQVIRDGLVLRSQPSLRSTALLELGVGSYVELGRSLGRTVAGDAWRQVSVGALSGWVLEAGLTPWRPATSMANPSGDDSRYAQPDQATPGKTVAIGGNSASRTPSGITPVNESTSKRHRVALVRLALRVTPDVNAPVLAQLTEGDIVTRLAEPPRGYWVAVQANGQRGWVASQWLQPLGDE